MGKIGNDYIDTGWQLLPLINGASQVGTANQPKYKFVSINNTNMLFIRGAVSNVSSKQWFCEVAYKHITKISSYAEYSKVNINSYLNTSLYII